MPITLPAIALGAGDSPAPAPSAAAPDATQPNIKPQEARTGETRTGKPLRHRHEAFCQYFVLYGNVATAAIEAGYNRKWASNQGYRLGRQPVIRARIAEIHAMLSRDYCLEPDVLLGKLEAVYQRAHENHHFHAAARAVEIQARIARQAWPANKAQNEMTTNDDISRPGNSGFAVNSIACAQKAGQK